MFVSLRYFDLLEEIEFNLSRLNLALYTDLEISIPNLLVFVFNLQESFSLLPV